MTPIYRAKLLEEDFIIKGFYTNLIKICGSKQEGHFIQEIETLDFYEINPKTLEISFDNGEYFYPIDEISNLVNYGGF